MVEWKKSSYSASNGDCIEIAFVGDTIAIRDSKDTLGPTLIATRGEWEAFVKGVKEGEFDL